MSDCNCGFDIGHPQVTRHTYNCASLRIRELEAENAELRLEIIAATGQAQTALEENAKLKGLIGEALSNMEYYSPSLGEMWLVQDSDITSMQAALGGE